MNEQQFSQKNINFSYLVKNSSNFINLKKELQQATKHSLTGITNFVVNHEDPCLVDAFLKECFKLEELYNNTIDIDAVELQQGQPGKMIGYGYLDELIYGSLETEEDRDFGTHSIQIDPQTGKRRRKQDGFVNRLEVLCGKFKDKLLVIKNIDFSMDFCFKECPGTLDPKSLNIFDNFRNPSLKNKCRILLISNIKLKFPFQVRTVEIKPVNAFEANHIIESFISAYTKADYEINFNNTQRDQIVRKISGLTYTEAGDAFASSLALSEEPVDSKKIDSHICTEKLRKKINNKYMEKGFGLIQLTPRPWEHYITPESSNFTWDVEKLLRDFKEVEELKNMSNQAIKKENNEEEEKYEDLIERIQTRMPHVILLYGKGGTGKSAFPIHLAGLLGFDAWDFNLNSVHSKWIGQGSEQARKSIDAIMNSSHAVIRIDEYDRAMGSSGGSSEGMHEAHKQVESEFMAWLQNGQEENQFVKKNIFVVLTTNHKESITGPMLRSGRVDLVIDIDNFDSASMKKAILTTAKRMDNKGIKVIGHNNYEDLQNHLNDLDLDQISEMCTMKGFTVKDVETLITEMSAHHYYHKKGLLGLEWNTQNFIEVLKNSEGSMKEDDSTGELVLGDRYLFMDKEIDENKQESFDFDNKNDIGFKKCT